MDLSRRSILGGLVTFAAAMVLDPERDLWVRGAKMISIPAPMVPKGHWEMSFAGRDWVFDPTSHVWHTQIMVLSLTESYSMTLTTSGVLGGSIMTFT